jgi:pyruvate formate lyase activating enzyme
MENLKYIFEAGVYLEITTLIVPGVNDKSSQLEKIARFIATELNILSTSIILDLSGH